MRAKGGGSIAQVLAGKARWAVVQGKAELVLAKLKLKDRSVDHVIADPPYEAEAHTLQRRVKRPDPKGPLKGRPRTDSRVAKIEAISFEPMTPELRRAMGHEIGRLAKRWSLVFCQVEATHLWRRDVARGGAKYLRTSIWVKPDGMPQLSGDRPGMGYESIVVFHGRGSGRSRWNGGGRTGVFTHCREPAHQRSGHETQKPLSLMLELVQLFTEPGDLILDPFCGSGSTGVAAVRLGRRFIGIELKPRYVRTARERLQAESVGLDLETFRDGRQLPLLPLMGGA